MIALMILGLAMIYSTGHLLVIQHKKNYSERTDYEKAVTWFAIVSIVLVFLGTMYN